MTIKMKWKKKKKEMAKDYEKKLKSERRGVITTKEQFSLPFHLKAQMANA